MADLFAISIAYSVPPLIYIILKHDKNKVKEMRYAPPLWVVAMLLQTPH